MKSHAATNNDGSASLAALITKIESSGDPATLTALSHRVSTSDLFDKKQAAEFLTIAVRTLDDWRQAKIIPCIERGRWIRFRRADLESFLDAHTVQPRKAAAYRPRRRKSPTTINP